MAARLLGVRAKPYPAQFQQVERQDQRQTEQHQHAQQHQRRHQQMPAQRRSSSV